MSLNKGIAHGKEHRKPYYNSGRFDRTCRPHGSCPYCQRGRQHKIDVRMPSDDTVLPRGYVEPEDSLWFDDWRYDGMDDIEDKADLEAM